MLWNASRPLERIQPGVVGRVAAFVPLSNAFCDRLLERWLFYRVHPTAFDPFLPLLYMNIAETLTIVFFLVGAVQGIIYGVTLLKSGPPNKTANRFLAAILFLLSYRLIIQSMRIMGLGYYDIYYYFMVDLSWVAGPLLYFYVKALTTPGFKLKRSDLWHFLPVLLQVAFSIFVRVQNLYWDGTKESLSWAGYWGYAAWMNYSTIYIVASFLIVVYAIKSETLLRTLQQDIEIAPERTQWIKRITRSFNLYFAVVLAILLVDLSLFVFINRADYNHTYFYFERFYYFPFFGGISILTYWLGLEGYKRKDDKGLTVKRVISPEKQNHLQDIATHLTQVMEKEKLYTNPELSLNLVAEHLDIKPYLLSACMKEVFAMRFNDYINGLRVQEVNRLLQDPENDKFTLLTLAMNAGFNSKSSFNRAVKKHLGISPSELRENP